MQRQNKLTRTKSNQDLIRRKKDHANDGSTSILQDDRDFYGRGENFAATLLHFPGNFCERTRGHFFESMGMRRASERDRQSRGLFRPGSGRRKSDHFAG